jgi:hypothetical protein
MLLLCHASPIRAELPEATGAALSSRLDRIRILRDMERDAAGT